jgi:hypothetical protein
VISGTDNRATEQVTDTDVPARKKTENKRATMSVHEYNRTKGSQDGMALFYRGKEGHMSMEKSLARETQNISFQFLTKTLGMQKKTLISKLCPVIHTTLLLTALKLQVILV